MEGEMIHAALPPPPPQSQEAMTNIILRPPAYNQICFSLYNERKTLLGIGELGVGLTVMTPQAKSQYADLINIIKISNSSWKRYAWKWPPMINKRREEEEEQQQQ